MANLKIPPSGNCSVHEFGALLEVRTMARVDVSENMELGHDPIQFSPEVGTSQMDAP